MKRFILLCFSTSLALAAYGASDLPEPTEHDVLSLADAAKAGDRVTIGRLFAMRADGAVAEDIDVVLGAVIRARPRLFLEELSHSWRGGCDQGLVGNFGDDYADDFKAQAEELSRRRTALKSVHDSTLRLLRDRCIHALDEDIQEVRAARAWTQKGAGQ